MPLHIKYNKSFDNNIIYTIIKLKNIFLSLQKKNVKSVTGDIKKRDSENNQVNIVKYLHCRYLKNI